MNDGCETAISRTGWGLCHYFLVGICGFCSLAESYASLVALVVTPLLTCDLHLDKNNVKTLNAINSIGMAFGGLFFGTLADANGRKSCITITMVLIFCSTIILAFAQKFFSINLAIFLLGFGVAGNNVTLRVYLIEFLPAKRRGICLALIDLLWVLGYLSGFGVAWSLIPSVMRMLSREFRPSSWRVLAGVGGAPSLLMACAASLLPLSPRYLLYQQNPERALVVLQRMYAINNSGHVDQFPPCDLEGCVRPDDDDDTGSRGIIRSIRKYVTKTWQRFEIIFRAPYTKISLFAIISRLFLLPGLVWLAMWKSFISYGDEIIVGEPRLFPYRQNSSICMVDAADVTEALLYNCLEANNSRFEYTLILSTSYIIGEGLLFFGIDVVGRKLSIVTSGMIGGTSILALIFGTRYTATTILSMFFLAACSIVYTTNTIIIMENYPTSVRGTIVGLTSVLPHLVAFFVKFFARVYCERSVYVATVLIIGATLASIPIPDLTKAPMRE